MDKNNPSGNHYKVLYESGPERETSEWLGIQDIYLAKPTEHLTLRMALQHFPQFVYEPFLPKFHDKGQSTLQRQQVECHQHFPMRLYMITSA